MKFLGVILARKGSRRIKNKNLKNLKNKPLVSWTIDFVNDLDEIDDVILSTDSMKIAKIGKNKTLIPWLRPAKYSRHDSKSGPACKHALLWYQKKIQKVDAVILFQPTSPFRSKRIVNKGIKIFKNNKRSVIAVTPLAKGKNLQVGDFQINKRGQLKYYSKKSKNDIYRTNGSLYITSTKYLIKHNDFKRENSYPLIIKSKKLSLDIDTPKDFIKAKKFAQNYE